VWFQWAAGVKKLCRCELQATLAEREAARASEASIFAAATAETAAAAAARDAAARAAEGALDAARATAADAEARVAALDAVRAQLEDDVVNAEGQKLLDYKTRTQAALVKARSRVMMWHRRNSSLHNEAYLS